MMMSAVMNNMLNTPVEPASEPVSTSPPVKREAKHATPAVERAGISFKPYFLAAVPPLLGIALLVLIWEIVSVKNSGFPSPAVTLGHAIKLFSDPFYQKG